MSKNALVEIKERMDALIGQQIMLRASGARKKTVERTGVLEGTYPSVFIVQLQDEQSAFKRVSYSYADVLTATVEVLVHDQCPEQLSGVQGMHATSV